MPKRIHLSRQKGWRMPEGAVKVDRGTRWGNPYRIEPGPRGRFYVQRGAELLVASTQEDAQRLAVEGFERYVQQPAILAMAREELRGKDLACWCKPGTPCHADVLLRVANA